MTKVISLSGFAGSGKDTAARYLIADHGFTKLSFAGTLKDAVAAIYGWDREMLEGTTPEAREARDEIDPWWSKRLGDPKLSPRRVLQQFGTEVCRKNIHQDIWVASLENQIRLMGDQPIVITDARFLNELTTLHNLGATTVRIRRGPDPEWFDLAKSTEGRQLMSIRSDVHPSEWDWAPWAFDVTLSNNGTFDDLSKAISNLALDLYGHHG